MAAESDGAAPEDEEKGGKPDKWRTIAGAIAVLAAIVGLVKAFAPTHRAGVFRLQAATDRVSGGIGENSMEGQKLTSPQNFTEAFRQVTLTHHSDLVATWDQTAEYTRLMRKIILSEVARNMKLESWTNDYYTLDAVFFREKDTTHFGAHMTYAKHLEAAIEHENHAPSSATEMNKLQLFNVPLKVLITYGNETEQENYLRVYDTIIKWADVFNDIGSSRRQLIIFGHKPQNAIIWNAYQYEPSEPSGFSRIP